MSGSARLISGRCFELTHITRWVEQGSEFFKIDVARQQNQQIIVFLNYDLNLVRSNLELMGEDNG